MPTPPTNTGGTLWSPGSGSSSFANVQAPDNLTEVVREGADQAKQDAKERVRAYETPVTAETLRTPTGC